MARGPGSGDLLPSSHSRSPSFSGPLLHVPLIGNFSFSPQAFLYGHKMFVQMFASVCVGIENRWAFFAASKVCFDEIMMTGCLWCELKIVDRKVMNSKFPLIDF